MSSKNQNGSVVILIIGLLVAVAFAVVTFLFISENQDKAASSKTADNNNSVQSQPKVGDASTDEEIKNDVFSVAGRIKEYWAENNGKYPITSDDIDVFHDVYVRATPELTHPVNNLPYELGATEPKDNKLLYLIGRACNPDGSLTSTDSPPGYVLQAKLTSGKYFCVEV